MTGDGGRRERKRTGNGRRRGRGRSEGGGQGRRGSGRIRAFLAFPIPDSVRHMLAGEMDRLRRNLPPARWIKPDNLHVTVKFLGQVDRSRLEKLNQGLAERLEELPPVEIGFGGAGFFPSASQARVVWVGGRADGMREVVEEVESISAMQNFRREQDEWRLHLTIARLARPWPRFATDELLSWGEDLALPRFVCRELVCFTSRLQAGGSVYTPVQKIALGGERE